MSLAFCSIYCTFLLNNFFLSSCEFMVDLMGAPGTLIPTEMTTTCFQLHDNAVQSVIRDIHQSEQNTHGQDIQIIDTSSYAVTAAMDPPCAANLQVLTQNNTSLEDNLISDLNIDVTSELGIKSNLLLDGSSLSEDGGTSLSEKEIGSVMDNVPEMEIPWENLRFGERIGLGRSLSLFLYPLAHFCPLSMLLMLLTIN
jgi:hypothetical protein